MTDQIDFDLSPYSRYRFGAAVYDKLPRLTFLIGLGDRDDCAPSYAARIVRARADTDYPRRYITPGGRLLLQFWTRKTSDATSVGRKQLNVVDTTKAWGWIIKPGDPGYDLLEGFKTACDHRRNLTVPRTLLDRAIDIARASATTTP